MLAPLAAHIQSLKKRLLIIAVTLGVAFATAFAYPQRWSPGSIAHSLTSSCSMDLPKRCLRPSKVSFLAGIILSLPMIFYHVWKFIAPALLPKEQRWAIPLFLTPPPFCLGWGWYFVTS